MCGQLPDRRVLWLVGSQPIPDAQELASKAVDSAHVYYWRGKSYLDVGDSAAANQDMDSSIAKHPTDHKVDSTIGSFLNLLGHYPEALKQ